MKPTSSGPVRSQSDAPTIAVSRQGLSARLLRLCGAVGVLAAAAILFLFGISTWTAIAVALLLACPAVIAVVLVYERKQRPPTTRREK